MPSFAKKMPIKTEDASSKRAALATPWHPLANLREQIDHLFEDFSRSPLPMPFGRRMFDVEPFFRRELKGIATLSLRGPRHPIGLCCYALTARMLHGTW